MFERNSFFWLLSILIVTQNIGLSRGIFVEKWIEQYQDHFDYFNDKIWPMRYYENDEFYHQSGPIFIRIGGESAITPGYTSIMYKMAKAYGAMMYIIEHRYYGKSHPVPDTSTKNLRYLSVSQALADIALFIEIKKIELNSSNAFTMVFGCSYAGNLAAWMRIKYPHLVQGALADSAPVFVKADFFECYGFFENFIRKFDENCAKNIKKAFSALEDLLESPEFKSIKNDFKLCNPNLSQPSEISYIMIALAQIFVLPAYSNSIEKNGKSSIENICISMKKNKIISPYYRLTEVFKAKYLKNYPCINLKYEDLMEDYLQTSWKSETVTERLWTYQTCTELGYHQTSSSPESIFGSLIPLKYFVDACKRLFPDIFNLNAWNHSIERINDSYNSKLSNTKNIIFTNGDHDPWHLLSVLSDLNTDSPAILIKDASHCDFLHGNKGIQSKSLVNAKCRVSSIICTWLHTHQEL